MVSSTIGNIDVVGVLLELCIASITALNPFSASISSLFA